MSLPASWIAVPITGTFLRLDGLPCRGQIVFTSAQVVVIGNTVVVPLTLKATLDIDGRIPVGFSLPSTTDPDLNITGWAYTVHERFVGGRPPYTIFVEHNMPSINLANATMVMAPPVLESMRGPQGYSVYELALQNGYVGTEAQWMAAFAVTPITAITATLPLSSTGGTAPNFSIAAATTAVSGSMSAVDKTKLDAILGSNTGDQTKVSLGLGNVDNTADANKLVSIAQAAADATVAANAAIDATTKANAAQTAAQTYAEGLVVGLVDDRGNYNASGNVFPTIGGSGAAGAILKGDLWTISVAGTLGGFAVSIGDLCRALVNAPGSIAANWALTENNIGYAPEIAGTAATAQAYAIQRGNHTGTQSADTLTDGATNKAFLAAERTKLAGIAAAATVNSADAVLLARGNHTGTQSADTLLDGATNKAFTAGERTKLTGVAAGATANSTDAALLSRANHTGAQLASTVSDFSAAADARVAFSTLGGHADVLITAIANGHVMAWESASGKWKNVVPAAGGGGAVWGSITGTLSGQTDLQTALNARALLAAANTFAQGVITANAPQAFTQTWNNAAILFDALTVDVTDTASNAASNFINLKHAGASRFFVTKYDTTNGRISVGTGAGALVLAPFSGVIWFGSVGAIGMRSSTALTLASNAMITGTNAASNFFSSAVDVGFTRNGVATWEINTGVAGTFGDLKLRDIAAVTGSFSGIATAPTAVIGTNTTQLATTAFVLANAGGGGGASLSAANTWTAQNTFAQGLITTNVPQTYTATYNNAAVAFTHVLQNITDTASAAGSLLHDWQVNGSSKAKLTKNGDATFSGVTLNGNISAPAWTTAGLRIKGIAATLTDTTSAGTVPAAYTDSFGGNTIAASSVTTFTNYVTAYFKEGIAGANVTLTNKWALGADSLRIGNTGQFSVTNAGVATFAQGTITANASQTFTQNWNNAAVLFDAVVVDVLDSASNAASNLLNLKIGGATKALITKVGGIHSGTDGSTSSVSFGRSASTNTGMYFPGTNQVGFVANGAITATLNSTSFTLSVSDFDMGGTSPRIRMRSSGIFAWSSSTVSVSPSDTGFCRGAAGVTEFNNGTAGTLADVKARNIRTPGVTVATLVAAATAGQGARCSVTDSTQTHTAGIGTTVVGGGANIVPVISDGTNWKIG